MEELLEKVFEICGIYKNKLVSHYLEYKKNDIHNIILPLMKKVFENDKQPVLNADNPELGIVLYILNKAGYKIKRKKIQLTYSEKTYEYNISK